MISFHCPFPPRGWSRPMQAGKRRFVDPKTAQYKSNVRACAMVELGNAEPIVGPVALTIYAHFEMPKSWRKWKREKLNGRPHTQKPDADNIAKAIADALNGLVYDDDAQIAKLTVEKRWLERAGFRVTVEELG